VTKPQSPLMTPREVAVLFNVDTRTITRWAKAGKIKSVKTPGGHRRYVRAEMMEVLKGVHDQA
jgi:excisionase family DNA binding protein